MAAVKVNVTLQADLLARIDAYCEGTGISRSAFLAMASSQYIDAIEKKSIVSDAFGHMGKLFKLALDGKTDSDEYAKALEDLEQAGDALKK